MNDNETIEIRCVGTSGELNSPNVLIWQSRIGMSFLQRHSGLTGASFCKTRRFEGSAKMVSADNKPLVDQA